MALGIKARAKKRFGALNFIQMLGYIGFGIIFILTVLATFNFFPTIFPQFRIDAMKGWTVLILMIATFIITPRWMIGIPILFIIGYATGNFELGFEFVRWYLFGNILGWLLTVVTPKLQGRMGKRK